MRRIAALAVVALGMGVAAWLLWPREPADDEQQIRAVIAKMAESAEKKDLSGILDHVSDGYRGEGGDKNGLKAYLLGYLLRSQIVTALPTEIDFSEPVQGGRAKVSLVVLLARIPAKKVDDIRPDQLIGTHHLEAELAKEEGARWRVVAAVRSDAGPGDLF
ncbi:MAG: hypothetical protein HY901_38470 [Deltaproteobacteria bacterium]|nr:hypothetical protein [Deltaproteobacteria bacterium]